MTVAVLHSYTHVLGWAYFRIGWAYFRVKGGPIFGRGVLENTPIPFFEQILNSSPMGVFSRDYGTGICANYPHIFLADPSWKIDSVGMATSSLSTGCPEQYFGSDKGHKSMV